VRIDHYLSARQRFFARVSRLERDTREDSFFPGDLDYPTNGGLFTLELRPLTSATLDDTFTISPTFIGSVRYGFSRRFSTITNGATGRDPSALHLPSSIVDNQIVKGYPIFTMGQGLPTIGSSFQKLVDDLHAGIVTLTKLVGAHSLKFGIDFRLTRINQLTPGNAAAGTFTFGPTFTQADPFTPSSGNTSGAGMASLLLAAPDSGSLGYTSPLSLQEKYIAGFIQEDWRANSKLTLNFGLRYDLETPYTERYNRITNGFNFNAPLPTPVTGLSLRGGAVFTSSRAPRVSAAHTCYSFGHPHRFNGLLNIMCSDKVRTVINRDGRAGEGAYQAIGRVWLPQDLTNERFARHANKKRKAENPQASEFAQDCAVPLVPGHTWLAEKPNPGIEHYMIARNPGLSDDMQAVFQSCLDPCQRATSASHHLARHDNYPCAGFGNQGSHGRIMFEPTHVIDDPRTRCQCCCGWSRGRISQCKRQPPDRKERGQGGVA